MHTVSTHIDTLDPKARVVELCRLFYAKGWASGTGGGVSLREGGKTYIAPSGVAKEWLRPEDLFVFGQGGGCTEEPTDPALKLSACAPLFQSVYALRDAGAVIHSHSLHAVLVTLDAGHEFRATHLEMLKGLRGLGYHDTLVLPIIDNTAHEQDLTASLRAAIAAYPDVDAVLVRRHGIYVWGRDWREAKRQAECYDYLFEATLRMRQLGCDAAVPPQPPR
ncbi:MAG: methylthioribulose 1-phosphate dehydratase [Polyangiales bacterium]